MSDREPARSHPEPATRPRLEKAAPILLASDMPRSIAYYRDELGFHDHVSEWGEPTAFAILWRNPVAVMLADIPRGAAITPNWKVREKTSSVYIWVRDVRAIYEEFLARGVEIDFELYEAPHGCLEFGVSDPDGHDISFGQDLG